MKNIKIMLMALIMIGSAIQINAMTSTTPLTVTFINKTGFPININNQSIANTASQSYTGTYANLNISIRTTVIPSTGLTTGTIIAPTNGFMIIPSTGTNFTNSTPFIITFSTTGTGKASTITIPPIAPKNSVSLKNAITGVVSLNYADALKKELSSATGTYSIIVGPKGGLHFKLQK